MLQSKISLLALALAVISSPALAANTTGNFQSTAVLNSSCIIRADNLNFGAVVPASTGVIQANGFFYYTCSNGLLATVTLGNGSSGTALNRTLLGTAGGNTDVLNYNVYLTVTSGVGTKIFGGEGSGGSNVMLSGRKTEFSSKFYGIMPLNQYVRPDSYADNLTLTIAY